MQDADSVGMMMTAFLHLCCHHLSGLHSEALLYVRAFVDIIQDREMNEAAYMRQHAEHEKRMQAHCYGSH